MPRPALRRLARSIHALLFAALLLLGAAPAFAGVAAASSLPIYDARQQDEALRTRLLNERFHPDRIAAERTASLLEQRVPTTRIDLEPLFGLPVYVRDLTGALTEAPAQGVDPADAVRDYIDSQPTLFGASAGDLLRNARLVRRGVTEHNGMTTLHWRQTHEGVEVVGSELRASVDAEGRVIAVSSTMLPPPPDGFETPATALRAAQGINAAALAIGAAEPNALTRAEDERGVDHHARFDGGTAFEGAIDTKMAYLPVARETLRPAYRVSIQQSGDPTRYLVFIDASDGSTLLRAPLTLHVAEPASYRVFADPATLVPLASPTPSLPGQPVPNGVEPPIVPRTRVTIPFLDPVASPLGWIDAGANVLRGPNAWVYLDTDADDEPDSDTQTGAPARVFDFPLDLSLDPVEYVPASLTQAFYVANWYHDRMHALGFTESFGNFQRDNFGRGGVGGDPMHVHLHDGFAVNNANFQPSDDGFPGVTQMFLWDQPSPRRDGALDTTILVHELTHGLSTRLAGIIGLLLVPQGGGLGEGWSDFYALSLLTDPSVDPALPHPVSGYASFGFGDVGDDSHYFGIRRYPYSTDMSVAPLTFADIDPAQFEVPEDVPRSTRPSPAPDQIHNIGEVWCSILWECRAGMIEKHGPEQGNDLMLRLVTDGLKLAPGQPDFVTARDAILLADAVNNGGENWPELWRSFARRGLGFGAASPNGQQASGVVESFAIPTYSFIYPDGRPTRARPDAPISFVVRILDPAPTPRPPSSVLAVADIGGQFQIFDAVRIGDSNDYRVELPPQPCGADVSFFLVAQGPSGTVHDPPADLYQIDIFLQGETVYEDLVEQDSGWSLAAVDDDAWSGFWERSNPSGGPPIQPPSDATPEGEICFHTQFWDTSLQAGHSMVNAGRVTLTSPRLDATGEGDAFFSWKQWTFISDFETFWRRWLRVYVSNDDGQTWVQAAETIAVSDGWEFREFRLADFVEPTDAVRIKFVAFNEFNWFRYSTLPPPLGTLALCEAAIDDVRLTRRVCSRPCPADLSLDGRVSPADLAVLLASWGDVDPLLDLDSDGFVGPGDLSILLAGWGPCQASGN